MCNCSSGKSLSTKLVTHAELIVKYLGRFHANPILVEQSSCRKCGELEVKYFDVMTKRELMR
jgi:hypothetical protein